MTDSRNSEGERRKSARLDIPIEVLYSVSGGGEKRAAKSGNISAGGCLLIAEEDLPSDSLIDLEILLGDSGGESLKIRGRIVRTSENSTGRHEYGIAFENISNEARRLFADFCFARMYEFIGLSDWPTDRTSRKDETGGRHD
ncbi:MAG TPA: PilZ domain-containing protein [bacterium]|jgi:c-di-GMP-binding flagellar brake protein YcgR|nr:PilZ domain-containing protein [Myxococcales bacterium]OQA59038.1 MAG: PilZ domain protein [bacterium ADurb.Bin270]HPW45704.1 PilZ domain-containing protein [bacterium]HQH80424.1 PilZ domain-containing protein [bacterium]